ncbi:MAG: ATP phosphoribosyltransferase regulatory subunit [Solirubrobacterales bacterium]|nr:ATP phosphoribosyltransferase regulatory subunit [Solirubrobacterales bacterium]
MPAPRAGGGEVSASHRADEPAPAVDRIPSGTRDVLPDEMRELRAMTDRVREVFERHGYGEVYTPALEYEGTFARAAGPGGDVPWPGQSTAWRRPASAWPGARPAYRMFDEQGNVLVLRSDMTIPIARLVATRYPQAEPPLRFSYLAHAYRGVRPQRGQSREFLQAGVELIGAPAPGGTAEALTVLCAALGAAGLRTYRVGLGDASLYPALLEAVGAPIERRERILSELVEGNFVGLEGEIAALQLPDKDAELLLRVPRIRGGPEVLEGLSGALGEAVGGMRDVHALLAPEVAERIIFDLGLVRSLGYYTGAVFQVYDPAYGVPIGGGGRYDELLRSFGRHLPAVGFALHVERLHIALTGEERGRGPRIPR